MNNENDYILDPLTSSPRNIEELVDWLLWESPSTLIPNKDHVKYLKNLLTERYNLYKEEEISNAIDNCNEFLEE